MVKTSPQFYESLRPDALSVVRSDLARQWIKLRVCNCLRATARPMANPKRFDFHRLGSGDTELADQVFEYEDRLVVVPGYDERTNRTACVQVIPERAYVLDLVEGFERRAC